MPEARIERIVGRRVWDSRGRPTVEAEIFLLLTIRMLLWALAALACGLLALESGSVITKSRSARICLS